MKYKVLISLILIYLFTSCSVINKKTSLWTNDPVITAYVEIYNAEEESNRIEVIYKENPAFSFYNEKKKADLIIGRSLNSPKLMKDFSTLNSLFRNKKLNRESFYKGSLKTSSLNKKIKLMPISFNLPALLFKKNEGSPLVKSYNLNLNEIISLSKEFNENNKNNKLAFSPRWDSETLFLTSRLQGAFFRAGKKNQISWDDDALIKSVEFIRQWSLNTNTTFENENKFANKYLYDPGYKLIDNKRILFFQSSLNTFFNIPENKRNQINFKWMSNNDLIPVCEDITFAGINKKSFNKKEAKKFILWLMNYNTQKKLLEISRMKRIRTFGIANGFSVLKNFNRIELTKFYPILLGHLPNEQLLTFPEKMPIDWLKMKETIIIPWLVSNCSTQEEIEPLINKILIYQKQRY